MYVVFVSVYLEKGWKNGKNLDLQKYNFSLSFTQSLSTVERSLTSAILWLSSGISLSP